MSTKKQLLKESLETLRNMSSAHALAVRIEKFKQPKGQKNGRVIDHEAAFQIIDEFVADAVDSGELTVKE